MGAKISLTLQSARHNPQFVEIIGDHDSLRLPLTQIHNMFLCHEDAISRSFNVLETLMRYQFNIPENVEIDVDRVNWKHPLNLRIVEMIDNALAGEGWDNVQFTGLVQDKDGSLIEYKGFSRQKRGKKGQDFHKSTRELENRFFVQHRGADPHY